MLFSVLRKLRDFVKFCNTISECECINIIFTRIQISIYSIYSIYSYILVEHAECFIYSIYIQDHLGDKIALKLDHKNRKPLDHKDRRRGYKVTPPPTSPTGAGFLL